MRYIFANILALLSLNSVSSDFASFGNDESIYTLSLTATSYFDTYVTENIDGTLSYNWDSATACYSPSLDNAQMQTLLKENIRWFDKVKSKPFYNIKNYQLYGDLSSSIKEYNSHSNMTMRGVAFDSFFSLGTNNKECDILLFNHTELIFLAKNERKELKFMDSLSLKKEYKNLNDLNIKTIWESDIFLPSSNAETGLLKLEKIISNKNLNNYIARIYKELDDKIAKLESIYKKGVDYFFVKLPSYRVDYEFCGIQYNLNKETPLETAITHLKNLPKSTHIASNINDLFKRIIKNKNSCGIVQASASDLDKLSTALERKKINGELLNYYVPKEKFVAIDNTISIRKQNLEKAKIESDKRLAEYECDGQLKETENQCVNLNKDRACMALKILTNRCAAK
jgi:hypothetical protein